MTGASRRFSWGCWPSPRSGCWNPKCRKCRHRWRFWRRPSSSATRFNLESHGVAVVGKIPSVPTPHIPDVSAAKVGQLIGGAFGLALIVFAESFSIANCFAQAHSYEVDSNQEMIGMGASNAAAGLFGGFAGSGSASRTAAADAAGGRTQMVSFVAAAFVLITAAFLTPLFTKLPEPVLGAIVIVIVAVRGFLRNAPFQRYWRRDRSSFAVAMTALFGVLVFDLLPGLIIAVGLSLVLFIARASAPDLIVLGRTPEGFFEHVAQDDQAVELPGFLIVRPNGGLFFGNVDRIRKSVVALAKQSDPPRGVVLVLRASFRLSLPVLDSLGQLPQQLHAAGARLWVVGVPASARQELESDELYASLGSDRIVRTIEQAVDTAQKPSDETPS